eukprot:2537283-Rhodomonas_salina.2
MAVFLDVFCVGHTIGACSRIFSDGSNRLRKLSEPNKCNENSFVPAWNSNRDSPLDIAVAIIGIKKHLSPALEHHFS